MNHACHSPLSFSSLWVVHITEYLPFAIYKQNSIIIVKSFHPHFSRPVVSKRFRVLYPFEHSTSSCVHPLAPGSAHSQMCFFLPSLYDTFIKQKTECEVLSQPGSWEVTKSSYRTRA